MSNEWFIIANSFSNSWKAKSLVDKAVKKLKEEKIKYSLNLTINSGDEIDLVKSATKNVYNKILAIGGDGTVQKIVAGIVMQQSISLKKWSLRWFHLGQEMTGQNQKIFPQTLMIA